MPSSLSAKNMEMVNHEEEVETCGVKEILQDASARKGELHKHFKGTSAIDVAGDVKKGSCCRGAALCLALLCFILLGLVAVAFLYIHRNMGTHFRSSYKKLVTEKKELEQRYGALYKFRDTLWGKLQGIEASCQNLTAERDGLKIILNDIGWMILGGSSYHVSSVEKSWQEGRDDCIQKGADLMIINSREEQDFANQFKKHLWIGLTDSVTEGTWIWVDGTPVNKSYWGPGEPNGALTENCGHIKYYDKEDSWNDLACRSVMFWICEKNVVP